MNADLLGMAMVGCGRVAPSHMTAAAANHKSVRLVTTCDVVPERAEAMRQHYLKKMEDAGVEPSPAGKVAATGDYDEVLANPAVDVVVIATESGYHAQMAQAALEMDKHVLVEKPISLDTRDARRLIATAADRGLTLGVCHQNRFNPPVQMLRRALESGDFGKLIYGTVHVRWSRDDAYYKSAAWRGTYALDGGCLMNQCIHGIDLLLWMMGEAERVYAETGTFLRPIEAEDLGLAVVRFRNGARGIIEGTTCIYPDNLEETLNIFGETGTCCLGGIAVNKVESFLTAAAANGDIDGDLAQAVDSVYGKGHTPLYADYFAAVRTGRPPYVDGFAGLQAMEMVLAIYKSAACGQPVELPLGDYSTQEAAAALDAGITLPQANRV